LDSLWATGAKIGQAVAILEIVPQAHLESLLRVDLTGWRLIHNTVLICVHPPSRT
jgi:hypothetical protein